jgi:hypothetical protein
MKCPHCLIAFHDNWREDYIKRLGSVLEAPSGGVWKYQTAHCPKCDELIIEIGNTDEQGWRTVYPIGAARGPVPKEVPPDLAQDYVEACNVLSISPKASAALSRRCLQNILHSRGYRDRDLAREIDLLLNETDPKKALPHKLRETVDAIRNFGNFSAHPIDDKTTLQVIEVEDHEAEWCLEMIEELFDHFYVGPAAAKAKKDALNAKLAAAGKPPAK